MTVLRIICSSLLLATALAAVSAGCRKPEVQYPKTPAPPPQSEPGSTTVERPSHR